MERLYLLIPDAERARRLIYELRESGVDDHHIHLVANRPELLEKGSLHQASLLDRAEFIPEVEKGAAAGGVTGLLAGLAAMTFPPAGLVVGGGAILGLGLLGAGLGAWIAGTVGATVPDHHLQELEIGVEQGNLLMLIDVPGKRVEDISELLKRHQNDWERELTGSKGPT